MDGRDWKSLIARGGAIVLLPMLAAVIAGCGAKDPKTRQGIITMGPHITETVFALGQGKQVIATGDFDDYPAEVAALPKVGGYLNPNLEKITGLMPALLIIAGQHPQLSDYAQANSLPMLSVSMDSLATIQEGIAEIGKTLKCERKATRLQERMETELQSIRDAVKNLERPKVLIITGRQTHDLNSLNTAGGQSFVSELVEIAGGENIFKDDDRAYFEASKETIVMAAPDVILEFHCGEGLTQKQQDAFFSDWRVLDTLPAIKNARVYFITEPHGLRPGPRVGEVALLFAKRLHPEVQMVL